MTTPPVPSITDEQLAEIEFYAESACQYAEDDWFALDVFNTMSSPNDAQYLASSTPWAIRALITRLRAAEADAARYHLLRDGSGWPAVFASHDAPEPLRGADLDTAMERNP